MKKRLSLILIAVFALAAFIPFASATTICPAAYNGAATGSYTIGAIHPTSNSIQRSAIAECFTANASCYLQSVTVKLARSGTFTDAFLIAHLYGATGTAGTDAYPSSTILATSTYLNCMDVQGSASDFTFTFDGSFHILSSNNYAISIEGYNGTGWGTSTIEVSRRTSDSINTMNYDTYKSSAWTASTSSELYYIITASDTSSGATPTPTPPTTTNPDDFWNGATGETITAAINMLLPLLFMFIPAFFFYKFAGPWGFFAGINVGIILCYLFIPSFPFWAVIVILIVDGLLLFGKVGLHN